MRQVGVVVMGVVQLVRELVMGQQQGKDQLPVDVRQEVTSLSNNKTIWTVHYGTRRPANDPVLVFIFNFANKSDDEIRQARSAHLRLKTLRHPNILRYIDGVELADSIYMMTEEATPLQDVLESATPPSDHLISWGIHQIIKSVSFLSNDCSLVHNNIAIHSVFVDAAGEWKLSGVEWMYSYNDNNIPTKFQSLNKYDPPETHKQSKRKAEKWSRDMWGLGCLLWEVFNGQMHQSSNLKDTSKFPKSLSTHYLQLINVNPQSRPNPSELLLSLRERGGYLHNTFVSLSLKIEELQLMEADRKNQFFVELNKSLELFPDSFAHYKVLPHLLNAFEFGGAGPTVLAPLLRIGKLLPDDEYQRKIVPCIVRSFGSNDRATRLNLLQHLDQFIDQLQSSVLNNSLFPQIITGFSDTVPTIREHTIKSSLLLAPKLNESNLNLLLKFFAKCQLDEQPGIRTNTTICLGKIAPHLNSKTRDRVLVSAFTRSLKDPFPPARSAGIGGLGSTHSYYSAVDMATRIIPSLSHMTVDKDRSVREQTFKVLRLFVDKLEENSKKMESSGEGVEQSEGSSSVTSWTAGWVSSISKYVSTSSKPEAPPTAPPTSSSSQRQEVKATPPVQEDSKWDEDKWEEAEDVSTAQSSGWDDEMWDSFEPTPKKTTPTSHTPATSAPLKLSSSRNKSPSPAPLPEDDFWTRLDSSKQSTRGREKATPPPIPSSLFDNQESQGGKMRGGGAKPLVGGASSDGWGDWDDAEFETVQEPVTRDQTKGSSVTMDTMNDGWDFEGGGWEDATPTTTEQAKPTSKRDDSDRQRELERKREERKARQEAVRKKRSTTGGTKPTGLGAVKKD